MSGAQATSTYAVTGMTCEHCVRALTQELSVLAGVQDVAVALVPGGSSTVTITASGSLAHEDVRAAVDEAGYDLVQPGGN